MIRRISRVTFSLCVLCVLCGGAFIGCASTAQGKLDQVEILYANTAGELNDLREAGKISPEVYHTDIAPNLRAAYAGIKRARAEVKAGNASEIDVLLKSINDSLLKLQPLRPTASPTSQSNIRAAIPPMQTAQVDPVSLALALGFATRVIAAVQTAVKGDSLTPEDHAAIQAATDAEAARVDKLDPPQT